MHNGQSRITDFNFYPKLGSMLLTIGWQMSSVAYEELAHFTLRLPKRQTLMPSVTSGQHYVSRPPRTSFADANPAIAAQAAERWFYIIHVMQSHSIPIYLMSTASLLVLLLSQGRPTGRTHLSGIIEISKNGSVGQSMRLQGARQD